MPVWGSELSCVLCAGTAGDCGIEVYGILLGVLIFTVLAVLHALYRVGCRKGVSMKVWTLGIVIGVVLFGLFLWWIWPAADF